MTEGHYVQFSEKVGEAIVLAQGDTPEDVRDKIQEMAKVMSDISDSMTAIKTVLGVSAAKAAPSSSGEPAKKSWSRGGSKPAGASGGSVCKHGEPWNDCNGKTTKTGKLYGKRFYSTCGTDDKECYAWGTNEG